MTFIKTLLLATALSMLSIAADTEDIECPANWFPNTYKGTKCCSGNMVIDEEGAYCCVYDVRPTPEALTATKTGETNWSTVDNSCIAEVRFTATDYSAQVSSASSKAEATPTGTSAGRVTALTTTGSSATTGTGSQTSTATPSSAASPTSNPAMPIATGQSVLSGAAIAAALFML
ncbi:hypothetical protein N7461_000239 [Penicillium sp. DV-2018c]|nr:hypothetical protein N7461_000239 [Penicillium sp. DV-2018c]